MDFRSLARYFLITFKIMSVPFSFINFHIYIHWEVLNLLYLKGKIYWNLWFETTNTQLNVTTISHRQ